MIPASYLFKDAFQQSFYDPDIAEAVQRQRHGRTGRNVFGWLRRRGDASSATRAGGPRLSGGLDEI